MPDVAPGVVSALPLVLVLVPVLTLASALFPTGADALLLVVLPWLVLVPLLGLATAFGLPGPTAEICVWLGTMGLPAGPLVVCPRNGIIA